MNSDIQAIYNSNYSFNSDPTRMINTLQNAADAL